MGGNSRYGRSNSAVVSSSLCTTGMNACDMCIYEVFYIDMICQQFKMTVISFYIIVLPRVPRISSAKSCFNKEI
mgnify:FL=1